jgi:hypothetical protein
MGFHRHQAPDAGTLLGFAQAFALALLGAVAIAVRPLLTDLWRETKR